MQRRRLTAIMFSDIVGYTALMGTDERSALAILRKNKEIHQRLLRRFNGQLLKEMGDGMLCSFETVTDAVYCAGTLISETEGVEGLQLSIGIHLGEVVVDGNELYGDGVNIASRIEGLATSGQLLVSETIYNNIKNKSEIRTTYMGEHSLKNVTQPVKVYSVKVEYIPQDYMPTPLPRKSLAKYKPWIVVVALLVATWFLVDIIKNPSESVRDNSIAVLPFTDMSPNGDQEYLGDGLADELISKLWSLEEMRVIARTSSFRFRGKDIDLTDVGEQLGVRYLVEGSVRKSGDMLRITVQLIDAGTNDHIWAHTFDEPFRDIFAIEDEITVKITNQLSAVLEIPVQTVSIIDPKAYDNYLKARHILSKYIFHLDAELLEEAEKLILQAISIDSSYGESYAALSEVYLYKGNIADSMTRIKYWNNSKLLIEKAMALDSTSCGVNGMYGYYWQSQESLDLAWYYYAKTVECDPNHPSAIRDLGSILLFLGLFDEADVLYERAVRIDPLNVELLAEVAQFNLHRGRVEIARKHFEDVLLLSSENQRTLNALVRMHYLIGDRIKAEDYLKRLLELDMTERQIGLAKVYYYATHGYRDSALAIAPDHWEVLAVLGMWEECMNSLENFSSAHPLRAGMRLFALLNEDPQVHPAFRKLYQPLLKHPRFPAYMAEIERRYRENVKRFSVQGRLIWEN